MLWQSTCRVSHAKNACSFAAKNLRAQQVRHLTLHEYQAYELLRQHDVLIPKGSLARTGAEVRACIESLGGSAMIKAQVLQYGGRGRGTFDSGLKGSIQRVTSAGDGESVAAKMLGHSLPTSQTAYGGPLVRQLYVVEDISPKEEWYVAITVDRERYCPILILSKKGGVDMETIARQSPEDVITIPLQYDAGINAEVLRSIQEQLALPGSAVESLEKTLTSLWTIFSEKDAILLELNPLALLSSDKFMPLGARFTFDDAAARRQPELFAMRDVEDEIPEEVEAEKYGLVYVRLDGNIGNVVNGAGLAMATNDAIGLHGGASANFLDAGGQATKETMIQAFRIILADQRVKAILVNIYGGITKCDMIAKSILGAASELGPITVPIVARLQGTNSAEGLRLLEEADLGIHVEAGFGEAAKKAVELAETNRLGAA